MALVVRDGVAVFVAPGGVPVLFDHDSVSQIIAAPRRDVARPEPIGDCHFDSRIPLGIPILAGFELHVHLLDFANHFTLALTSSTLRRHTLCFSRRSHSHRRRYAAAEVAMKLKPLGDRIIVRRTEAAEKTAGGILLPDTAKNKPQRGKVLAVGPGKMLKDGTRRPLQVKEGDSVLFTTWAGDEFKDRAQRRRHPRSCARKTCSPSSTSNRIQHSNHDNSLRIHGRQNGCEADCIRSGSPRGDAPGHRQAGPGRQGDARAQGPQRHPAEELRLADRHQGRRHRRQGNRAGRQVREHGRPHGPRGRLQDQRRGRRRHHHRHRPGRGHLQRRPAGRRLRRQPDAHEARHREGRRGHRRASSRR